MTDPQEPKPPAGPPMEPAAAPADLPTAGVPEPGQAPEGLPEPAAVVPQPERYPFWSYLDLAALAGMALPMLLVASLITLFLLHSIQWGPRIRALGPIAATFAFYGFWFLVLFALIRLRYGRPFWRSLRWVRSQPGVLACVLYGLLTAAVCVLLGVVLHPPEIKTPLEQLLQDSASVVLMGVFAVTLGPLCEELAFRGFLQPLLTRTFGAVGGVLLQAVPFTLLHGFEYAWSWQRLLIIFFAGASFGWMRHTSGSTANATYMHSAYNLTFFAGLLAQRYAR